MMKAWVDTAYNSKDTWLVLVFHAVDSLGYEALNHQLLDEYFQYIKGKQDKLWVATFGDVTKYMREREAAKVNSTQNGGKITVMLTHSLDKNIYDLPLTLKTYVPSSWKTVKVEQGKRTHNESVVKDEKGSYVMFRAEPNGTAITLSGA